MTALTNLPHDDLVTEHRKASIEGALALHAGDAERASRFADRERELRAERVRRAMKRAFRDRREV